MKHSETGKCELCDFRLKQCHDTLREWFETVVKPEFKDAHIAWGWRGETDQNDFYAEKKSRVKWPDSLHNKMDAQGRPWSFAVDLFRQVAGKALFSRSDMEKIWQHTEKCGWDDRIQWGIFVSGKREDFCHFQLARNLAGANRG